MKRGSTVDRLVQLADQLELQDRADGWPSLGVAKLDGSEVPVALYIGSITRSHRNRDDRERRFQNPGSGKPIVIAPQRLPLLLGLWERDDILSVPEPVVVSADPMKRHGRTSRFSVFVPTLRLAEASRTGWSAGPSSDGERLIACVCSRFDELVRDAVNTRDLTHLQSPALTGDRHADIRKLAEDGLTLESIASQVGLTRERVRQIIRDQFPELSSSRKSMAVARRRVDAEVSAALARRTKIADLEATLRAQGIDPADVVLHLRKTRQSARTAAHFQIADVAVRELHAASDSPFPIATRASKAQQRHTDDQILEYMRLAANSLQASTLSSSAYNAFAVRQRVTVEAWPTSQTIAKRFGGWRSACDAAGLEAREPRREYTQDFPPARCRHFVDRYVAEALDQGRRPTFAGYESWARGTGGPSGPTVRTRLGSWGDAVAASLHRLGRS